MGGRAAGGRIAASGVGFGEQRNGAATAQGSLDDSKVAAIAALQGSTISRLLVEKERLKSRVYTNVLNPEQRNKADELQKEWRSRLDYVAARIGSGGE